MCHELVCTIKCFKEINADVIRVLTTLDIAALVIMYGPGYDLSRSMEHMEINLCYRNPRGSGFFRRLPNTPASFAKILTLFMVYVRKLHNSEDVPCQKRLKL